MPNWFENIRRRRLNRFAAERRAQGASLHKRPRYRYVRWKWRVLFNVIDGLGFALLRLSRLLPVSRRRDTESNPRRILVVQQDHLGDAIISTGLLRGLRHAYPSAAIDVLASDSNRELFAACPEVTEVLTASVNRFARGRRFGWMWHTLVWGLKLRQRGYDLAIDPRGEFTAACILWLSGARRRLGWACGGGAFWLTDLVDFVPNRPEVLSRQAVLNRLGIAPPPGEAAWAPRVEPACASRRWAEAQFAEAQFAEAQLAEGRILRASGKHSPSPGTPGEGRGEGFPQLHSPVRPLIVCHLGAGTSAKRWPAEHWRQLVHQLVLSEYRVVLAGGRDDQDTANLILSSVSDSDVEDRTGRLTLLQLASLLERAELLIGADSGPAHLAAAIGAPVVVLFSGTNADAQWRPWGRNVTVVRQPVSCSPCHRQTCPLAEHPCMRELSPGAVLAAVDRAMERSVAIPQEVLA